MQAEARGPNEVNEAASAPHVTSAALLYEEVLPAEGKSALTAVADSGC